MGIFDFLGGSDKSGPTKQDKEFQKELFELAKEVGKIPYQPWTGIDVASFNPQQDAAMQSFADMGNAFGMGMPTDVTAGRPKEYTDASGVKGYSSFPAWMQNLKANKNTPAAGRYADFYGLGVDSLYGSGNATDSVTGIDPTGSGTTTGGKGPPPGTGTGTGSGTGGSAGTGGKGPLNSGLGNIMGMVGAPNNLSRGFTSGAARG